MRDPKTTARQSQSDSRATHAARREPARGTEEVAVVKEDGLIGGKLRALRLRQNKTLQAVSATTGISVGHLSQLERDLVSPSIKTLHDLSRALGVNISWFFLPQEPGARVEQYIVRRDQRRHISYADGIDDYQLNSQAVRHLGLLYSTFAPGASSGDSPYTHEGEEAGYVVCGQLELWIDGASTVLSAGDSFSFPSTSPHRYCNPGRAEAVVLWAMTPPTY
ncbi:MAG: cupin domain-containing protein [Gammaproteobacteria bacterium]|nr:cupin domain-containing protein [Gammaproteobacteria bacterium]